MKIFILVISVLIGLCTVAEAQQYAASVKHYGPEQGLSHREVNAIFRDQQGFMWFGTRFGLNRFDGLNFTPYTKERNGLGFDDIQSIAQDAEGNLWLMGNYGQSHITLFNPQTNQAISFEEKFKKQRPSHSFDIPQRLLSGTDGTIFFTNYRPAILFSYHSNSGLREVPLPQFKQLAVFQVTARNTVWAIADDKNLIELAADGRILHQFHYPQKELFICFGQRNAGIEFFYFVHEPDDKSNYTLYSMDELGQRRERPVTLLNSLNRYIFPVCYPMDRSGLIWDGLSLRDSTGRSQLTLADQTSGEPIENRSFYRDQNGQFWLGTSFGVYQVKLTENHFQRMVYPESNPVGTGAAVRGITVRGDSVFTNLEKLGLYAFPREGGLPRKLYASDEEFAAAYGLSMDGQSKLYAGIGSHLLVYDAATGGHTTSELPEGSELWTFHQLDHEQWLAGGPGGLLVVNAKNGQAASFGQYNQFTELSEAHILHIAPDRQGTLWICANTGLYTVDPAKGITARYWIGGRGRFYLPAESYQHFYQDLQGIYWLATANAGLIRWDSRQHQYRQFRRSEGLSNDNIYAVYPDARGDLWLSSDFGIMRFDPVRFTTRAYFVEDGIAHNEFNRIAHFQDKNGRIYFGGLHGITAFDPRDFQTEKLGAGLPLRVTSFRQYAPSLNKIVDKTGEVVTRNTITIEPDDRSSVLDFALLDYAHAEKNVYAYQFKGIDKDWTYQSESWLRLSNLPYGGHQLLIKAQAADGQWAANTLVLNLQVVRPFYLRIWFVAGMVLLAGVSVWAWLRWRIWQHKREQIRLENQVRQATLRIEQDKQTMAQDKEIIEKQAQTLFRLNETKSRFFANISHEFRTPLTVILGMATQLNDTPDQQPQKLQQAARLIARSGNNLLRLINQILDLSKIEAGEMHLQPVRADLVGFTRYVGESFHSMARARDIQLHFLSDEGTCEADFDKDKLGDIIANLLSNALKFTPAGGNVYCQVRVRDGWQSLSPQGFHEELAPLNHLKGQWIQISISDTGPGIEPASLPRIFDRFYQADNQAHGQMGGTGIGLSLVRELVVLMQGGLAVRNRQKNGAEFVVSLPLTRLAIPLEELLPAPELAGPEWNEGMEPALVAVTHKPVLLLVEDNDDVAQYIQTCVQSEYQVMRAENGQVGIELALEKMPDLILSDVMMPVKDGFALCNALKNDERTSHIPIVLLTARAAVSDRIAGLRRGADAYLVKPFLREELLVVLNNQLHTRRLLQLHYSQLVLGSVPAQSTPAVAIDAQEDQFLTKLRTAVEAQLDNAELSLEDICQLVGMSRATLHRKLTALTGMSVSRYLRVLRLRKAKQLLSTSELNVSEVAYAVGFGDPRYFSRVFSEEFGVTPAHFRHSPSA